MNLPDHLTDLIRGLLESDKSDPGMVYLTAAALADELRDWVGNPAGYVPREVLAGTLSSLNSQLDPEFQGGERVYLDCEAIAAIRDAAGQCPAWFVLADFGRMTNLDIIKARLWVRRNAGRLGMYAGMGVALPDEPRDYGLPVWILDQPADVTNWELSPEAIAQMQEFEQQARPAEFQITGHWPPADDVQASREAFVRERIDVPEGWRFVWAEDQRTVEIFNFWHDGHDGEPYGRLRPVPPMTFTRGMMTYPNPNTGALVTETLRTHVGRCERCQTVYATRPEVVRPYVEVSDGNGGYIVPRELAPLAERLMESDPVAVPTRIEGPQTVRINIGGVHYDLTPDPDQPGYYTFADGTRFAFGRDGQAFIFHDDDPA